VVEEPAGGLFRVAGADGNLDLVTVADRDVDQLEHPRVLAPRVLW
jgi:hypothetical protein